MNFYSVVLLASALALGPALLYASAFWWLDRYEKEPLPLLLTAFFWGAVPAVALALVFEVLIGLPLQQVVLVDRARAITEAALVAPVIEETVKAVILVVLFLALRREFDNVLDGVIYGAMVGLGFALVENVLYFTYTAYDGVPSGGQPRIDLVLGLWFFRAGVFGLNHSMFTAFTGAALGYARSLRFPWQRTGIFLAGLAAAIAFHATHNSLVSATNALAGDEANSGLLIGACFGIIVSDWGGLLLILAVAIISSVREGQVIKQTLWEEVALGRLTPDEYNTLMSGRRRWSVRWAVLFSSGFKRWRQVGRFFDLSTELAFRKHRMTDGDPHEQNLCAQDIARLRGDIDSLKMTMLYARG